MNPPRKETAHHATAATGSNDRHADGRIDTTAGSEKRKKAGGEYFQSNQEACTSPTSPKHAASPASRALGRQRRENISRTAQQTRTVAHEDPGAVGPTVGTPSDPPPGHRLTAAPRRRGYTPDPRSVEPIARQGPHLRLQETSRGRGPCNGVATGQSASYSMFTG